MKRILLALAVICPTLEAAPPGWWSAPDTKIIEDGATPNNSGPVNQAQLKNVATKAALYLDNELIVGAGPAVHSLVDGFENNPATAFQPVNLGQLKAIAKPFYDRLLEIGYGTKANLVAHGASGWNYDYPWISTTPKSVNLAPASIGQLKWVFSFDLTSFSPVDADSDGLADFWELENGFSITSSDENNNGIADAYDDNDDDGVLNYVEEMIGTDPGNVDSDGDGLSDSEDDYPLVANPTVPGAMSIKIPDFDAKVGQQNADYSSIDYTKINLQWEDSQYGPTGYQIEQRIDAGSWETLAVVAATQYQVENLLAGQRYQFRVSAYRKVGGVQAWSDPVGISYEVPTILSFDVKSSSVYDVKEGFEEYVDPSTPPKYYLSQEISSTIVGTDDYSDIYTHTTSEWNRSYYSISTINAASRLWWEEGSYSAEGSSTKTYNSSGATATGQSSEAEQYEFYTQYRDRDSLSMQDYIWRSYESQASSSSTLDNSSHSSSESVSQEYLYEETYVPDSGAPIWMGYDYDLSKGSIAYSGSQHSRSDFLDSDDPPGDRSYSGDYTVAADGTWSGTGTYIWNGVNLVGDFHGGILTGETQTTKTYYESYYGTISSGTYTLSQEYTTEDFITDVIYDLPDYPSVWTQNYSGSYGLINWGYDTWNKLWWGYYSYFGSKPGRLLPTVSRDLGENESYFGVGRMKYRLKTSPSVPQKVTWVEAFVPKLPEPGPSPSADPERDIDVYASCSWTPNGSASFSDEHEVPEAVDRQENGEVDLVSPQFTFMRVKASDDTYNVVEENQYASDWNKDGTPIEWTPMEGGGYRIFPDENSPTDTQPRDTVDVEVSVGVAYAKVWLKIIDVDDPTPAQYDVEEGQHIVDPNDQDGEKGGDNTEDTGGKFTQSNSAIVACVTDYDGVAKIKIGDEWELPRLKVGMQPGFNYRVAVAFKESDLDVLQVTNKSNAYYVPPSDDGVEGFKGGISSMLTVWRRLNIEIDSMEAVPNPKPAPDHATLTVDHVSSNSVYAIAPQGSVSDSHDFYAGGMIIKNGKSIEISSYSYSGVPGVGVAIFELPSAPIGFSSGDTFDVYDDDDKYLAELALPAPLPKNDPQKVPEIIDGIREVYAHAYIELIDANANGWNENQTISFQANATAITPIYTSVFDTAKGLIDSPNFWAHTIVFGYQAETWRDADPNIVEGGLLGGTPEMPVRGCEKSLVLGKQA